MSQLDNAAEVLNRHLSDGRARGTTGYREFDPNTIITILLAALGKLLDCLPNPDDGWEYLAWRPRVDLFGIRRDWHRSKVRERLGGDVRSRVFCELVFKAIDKGEVGPRSLAGLYTETKARY